MVEKKKSEDGRHVFVMTPTGLEKLSTRTSDFASLLKGRRVDTKAFMDALSEAISELESDLESTERTDSE